VARITQLGRNRKDLTVLYPRCVGRRNKKGKLASQDTPLSILFPGLEGPGLAAPPVARVEGSGLKESSLLGPQASWLSAPHRLGGKDGRSHHLGWDFLDHCCRTHIWKRPESSLSPTPQT
jgi:hypothetical protein